MKRPIFLALSALVVLSGGPRFGPAAPAAAAEVVAKAAPDLSGAWDVTIGPADSGMKSKLQLERDGAGWKGSFARPNGTPLPVTATLAGSQVTLNVSFTGQDGATVVRTNTFTLDGDTFKGSVKFGNRPEMAYLATRAHAGPTMKPSGPLGDWTVSVVAPDQTYTSSLTLKKDGDQVTGMMKGDQGFGAAIKTPSVTGNDVKFSVDIPINGNPVTFDYAGTVDGDAMKGTVHSPFGDFPFTAKRKPTEGGAAAGVAAIAAAGAAKGIEGDWQMSFGRGGGFRAPTLTFKRDGDHLTGTQMRGNGDPMPLSDVSVTGNIVKFSNDFKAQDATIVHTDYTGTIDGDDMTGTAHSSRGDRPFTARRKSAGPKSYEGIWILTISAPDKTYTPEITLAQTGEKLTGTLQQDAAAAGMPIEDGTASNGTVHFFVQIPIQGQKTRVEFTGKADGEHLAGQMKTDAWSIPWTADRKKGGAAK